MEDRLLERFGRGPVARAAARQALSSMQQPQGVQDPQFEAMFEFQHPVPSGLVGQPDMLVADAAGQLAGMPPVGVAPMPQDPYPYRGVGAPDDAVLDASYAYLAGAGTSEIVSRQPVLHSLPPQDAQALAAQIANAAAAAAAMPSHAGAGPATPAGGPSARQVPAAVAAGPYPQAQEVGQPASTGAARMPAKYQRAMQAAGAALPQRAVYGQDAAVPYAPAPGALRGSQGGVGAHSSQQGGNAASVAAARAAAAAAAAQGPVQTPAYYLTSSPPSSPEPARPGGRGQYARDAEYPERRPQPSQQQAVQPPNYHNAPRRSSDIIRQARGRPLSAAQQPPSPVLSPRNVVGPGAIVRRSATRLPSDRPRASRSPSPSGGAGAWGGAGARPPSAGATRLLADRIAGPAAQQGGEVMQYEDMHRRRSPGGVAVNPRLYSPPRTASHAPNRSPAPRRGGGAGAGGGPGERSPQRPAWARPDPNAAVPPGAVMGQEGVELAGALNGGYGAGSPPQAQSPAGAGGAGPRSGASSPGGEVGGGAGVRRSGSPGGGAGWTEQGFVSSSYGRQRKTSPEREEQFYHAYRVRRHRDDYPDVRYSQPRSEGPHAMLAQHVFSFDEAHPAIAGQHYLRSTDQEELLHKERQAAEVRRRKAEKALQRQQSRSRSGSRSPRHPTPSVGQLRADVDKLARVRDTGRERLRHLEQEGEALRSASRDVQQRALDAIANAEAISRRHQRSRSPSPGAGSAYRGSRSPSPGRFVSRPVSASAYEQYGVSDQGVLNQAMAAVGSPGTRLPSAGGRPLSAPASRWVSDIGDQYYEVVPLEQDAAVQAVPGEEMRAAEASLADYIARDAGVRLQGDPVGPALTEAEFRMASGAFDPAKFEEYNRQMDAEAEERAIQRGYESDKERERQAAEAAAYEALSEQEKEALARAEAEARELANILRQTWQEQDSWMDDYRQRLGPQEGYSPRSDNGAYYLVDQHSPRNTGSLGPQDEQLVGSPFVPELYSDLGHLIAGPRPRRHSASSTRPFTPTVPVPFTFEERAKQRPKMLMQVKREQDREIRKQEEEAARRYRFTASPIPKSTMDAKYERMMLEAEVRRQINRESRMAELSMMMERPFSFQERDEERAAFKEAVAAAAKDPKRFQIPFRAKPIPGTVKQEKFKFMQLELEAKRAAARARMEAARAKARERVEEDVKQRQTVADRAYKERLRAVDPIWNQKYDTKPMGAVPDFNLLHNQWEQRLATLRALNRRRVTVPKEFGTHNARDAAEAQARERKALERRQRILLDMALDEELLPETRWPHRMPRGRVRPTPPPPLEEPDFKVSDTRANMLRRAATHSARRAGRYDDPADKERRAMLRARREAEMRARTWMNLQQELARKKGGNAGGTDLADFGGGGASSSGAHGLDAEIAAGGRTVGEGGDKAGAGTAARRAALEVRKDTPVMHIEARHMQVEKKVKGMVEDALLSQGLDAYKAYKYSEG